MKKTLALILALVMVAFAFASCGKGGKSDATTVKPTTAAPTAPEATTAEPTQPTCQHVPEDTWRVYTPATCSAPGVEKLYCKECGEELEERPIAIDPDAHKVDEWTVTEAANMLNPTGSRTGVCTLCLNDVVEDILWEGPTIKAFNAFSERYGMAEVKLEDVRGDDHFYPTEANPDGKDLYVEFSILWNETVLNFDASKDPYMVGRFYDGKPFYYLSPVAGMGYSDANFSGAFEWMGNFATPISDSEVTTPATMCGKSSNYADYPNINGADPDHPEYGWHRIGIRYHFELLDGKSGAELADYRGTVTVYVDGTAIFKLSTGDKGMQDKEAHLFNAERDGDTVTYSDVDSFIIPFQINKAQAKADKTVYLALADLSVTCGDNFVMQVEKVASPAAATLTVADGVDIPAPIYFKLAD